MPEQPQYWAEVAKHKGYKTAKGCCKAYYFALLKELDEANNDSKRLRLKLYRRHDTWKGEPLDRIDYEEESVTELTLKVANGEMTIDECISKTREYHKKRGYDSCQRVDEEEYEEGKLPTWRFNIPDKPPHDDGIP